MTELSQTPEPPYYAVIFASIASDDRRGYGAMAEAMDNLAKQQPGYLGIDSARSDDGLGITVSYWRDEASILGWKQQADHLGAQQLGKERWYASYSLRVAKVERAYFGPDGR